MIFANCNSTLELVHSINCQKGVGDYWGNLKNYTHNHAAIAGYCKPTFLAARVASSSLLAPVQTIFPDANTRAVVFGSLILMITAANLCEHNTETSAMPNHAKAGRELHQDWSTIMSAKPGEPRLGVVLRVPGVQGDLLKVQLATEVDGCDHILELGNDARGVLWCVKGRPSSSVHWRHLHGDAPLWEGLGTRRRAKVVLGPLLGGDRKTVPGQRRLLLGIVYVVRY